MKRITITATTHGQVVSLAVSGHLDGSTAPELSRDIHNLIADGIYRIVVDFKDCHLFSI